MEKTTITKTGLRLFEAKTPLKDYFSTILDIEGGWTAGMLETEDQPTSEERGLMIWEGSCEITTEPDGEDTYTSYRFDGAWRRPTQIELRRLGEGQRPFGGQKFPTDDEELVSVPA